MDADAKINALKYDESKRRYDLMPYDALEEVLKVLEFGANKYDDDQWLAGTTWSRYWSAAMRHLVAFWRGEDNDPESGLPHLAHATCCALFLLTYSIRKIGMDNRSTPHSP